MFLQSTVKGFPLLVRRLCMELLFGVLALLAIVGVMQLNRPKCPQCGRRSVSYRHQRRDGQADRRYRANPQTCSSCGWTGYGAA